MSENKIVLVLETKAQNQGIVGAINALKGLGSAANMVDGAIKRMGSQLLAAFSVGAVIQGFRSAVNAADDLSKAAQRAGVAVETFSALAYVGSLASVSAQEMVAANKHLSAWLEKTGQSGRSLTEVLIEQSDVFASMPDGVQKIRLAVEMFGKAGQQMIPLLNQGSEAIREQMEEAEQFGTVIGPRFSRNSQAFNDNLTRMWAIVRGLFNMIADALLPTFIEWQERVIQFVKDTGAHVGAVDTLIQIYKGFAITVATLGAAFELAFGVPAKFLGALSAGAGLAEAWESAGDGAVQTFDKLEKKLNSILDVSRRVDKGGGQNSEATAVVSTLDHIRLELENNAVRIDLVNKAFESSEKSRNGMLRDIYSERLKLLERFEKELSGRANTILAGSGDEVLFTQEYAEVAAKLNGVLRERAEILDRINSIDGNTFFGRLELGFRKMADEVENFGAAVADVMLSGVRRSIDVVADGLWAVIDGTRTWGEIFLQVGRSIISDLIRIAIQETIVLGVKKSVAMAWKAFTSWMRGADVVEANATEAAKTPALATNATLASISSWGIAVVIGLAAIAGILASMGAFEEGGVVKGGRQVIMVNEGGQEAVLNARATAALGEDRIAALNAGRFDDLDLESRVASNLRMNEPMASRDVFIPSGQDSGAGKNRNFNLVLVDKRDPNEILNLLGTAAFQAKILDVVRNGRTEVGIET